LGFGGVGEVRVGRAVELLLDAASADAARADALQMCERLLANPVTEDYVLEGVEPAA
jgi:phosphoribosylformylglycinamidine synthase